MQHYQHFHDKTLFSQPNTDRLCCVRQADVDEALRLMLMSKISLRDADDRQRTKVDPIAAIYGRVREDILRHHKQTYTWEEVTSLCSGYTVSSSHLQCVACAKYFIPSDSSNVHALSWRTSFPDELQALHIWILLAPTAKSSHANTHFSMSD